MNILIADKFEQAGIDGLGALGCAVFYEPAAGAEGLTTAIAKVRPDVLVVRSSKVPREVLEKAAGLRAIIRAGAGVDNIDVPAATERGIAVANCPGMNSVAVAELAMGLIIACDRRIADQTAELRAGTWNKKEYAKAKGLKGSVLGIIGPGAIGREVARRAKAFDMHVIGWSPLFSKAEADEMGIEFGGLDRASLVAMVRRCDAVTVHVPLSPETKHLCNAEFFAAMKNGAIFVNTSRGGVVDEAALRSAVASKNLRCGLDVYEGQPAAEGPWTSPTVALKGGAFTHHCGASTAQAQAAVGEEVVRVVKVLRDTGKLENCVNPGAMPQVQVRAGGPAKAAR